MVLCMVLMIVSAERLKCGTAETERPEQSELAALSAVATTDLFGFPIYLQSVA